MALDGHQRFPEKARGVRCWVAAKRRRNTWASTIASPGRWRSGGRLMVTSLMR